MKIEKFSFWQYLVHYLSILRCSTLKFITVFLLKIGYCHWAFDFLKWERLIIKCTKAIMLGLSSQSVISPFLESIPINKHFVKSVQIESFFLVRIQVNTDQKNSIFGYFSHMENHLGRVFRNALANISLQKWKH